MRIIQICLVLTLLASTLVYGEEKEKVEAPELTLLRSAGAVTYAEKADYGGGIESMFLGYDKEGTPIAGVARRETKTYKKVTALVLVVPDEKGHKISAAEVPDIEKVPGKAKDMVKDALKDITGKTFADAKDTKKLVDAVSGASKYYKAIYVSYGVMARKVITEMEANPEWEKKPLATDEK